ncbi:MAG: hypothetical protein ACREIC_22140, partial [Limisphaerales bacterium]
EQAPNYHREFFKSPHHAALGLLTLGLGFLSAQVLGLIAGLTAYVLGWIYLPDLPFFRRWVDRRTDAAKQAVETQKVTDFVVRRDALVRSLSPERRERYGGLAKVCRDIETATADNLLASADPSTDPRLRKLDELMWTLLRLLGIEQSLEQFLETERRENLPALVTEAEAETARLNTEVEALKTKGGDPILETRQRFLSSRLERLEVLRKRQQRIQQADANLALVVSEQDRLEQQIKLIRADAVATKNAETLTARIDATVEHLDQTNKWLSELDEFKDLVGDMPATELRVGYQASPPTPPIPPVIDPSQIRRQSPARQRQSG